VKDLGGKIKFVCINILEVERKRGEKGRFTRKEKVVIGNYLGERKCLGI